MLKTLAIPYVFVTRSAVQNNAPNRDFLRRLSRLRALNAARVLALLRLLDLS